MSESASPYVVTPGTGWFVGGPEFLDSLHKIDTAADADAYLARLEAFALSLDQETERVNRDVGNGVCPPTSCCRRRWHRCRRFLRCHRTSSGW